MRFAAQDAIDVTAAQKALDDHNGFFAKIHNNFTIRVGRLVEMQMLKASDSLLQMSCPTASQCHPWPPELTVESNEDFNECMWYTL